MTSSVHRVYSSFNFPTSPSAADNVDFALFKLNWIPTASLEHRLYRSVKALTFSSTDEKVNT